MKKVMMMKMRGRRSLLGGLWIFDSVFGLGLSSTRANRSARLKKGSKLTYRTKYRCEQIKKKLARRRDSGDGRAFSGHRCREPLSGPPGAPYGAKLGAKDNYRNL